MFISILGNDGTRKANKSTLFQPPFQISRCKWFRLLIFSQVGCEGEDESSISPTLFSLYILIYNEKILIILWNNY